MVEMENMAVDQQANWSASNPVPYDEVALGSGKRYDWVCKEGHSWTEVFREQMKRAEPCPYCSGRKALSGFNTLDVTNPEVLEYWDDAQNSITPGGVMASYSKEVHLRCPTCDTQWATKLNRFILRRDERKESNGCPTCSGRQTKVGFNDLLTLHPRLVQGEWDYQKNTAPPTEYTQGSAREVWWICPKGHSYEMAVKKRAISGRGCGVCSGNQVQQGFNDLASAYPHLAKEWSIKNLRQPSEYSPGSEASIIWECDKGHEWKANINNRAMKGSGCPTCAIGRNSSRGEKEILAYLETLLPQGALVTNTRSVISPYELDIYIPSKKFAIEFNGVYWHTEGIKGKNFHYDKWRTCRDLGIQLVQVWEDDWTERQEVVKSMLSHKLGLNDDQRVGARKTTAVEVVAAEAATFLTKNHIQGYVKNATYYGLCHDDQLVAVMAVTQTGNEAVIARYATSVTVVGGFTKLLKCLESKSGVERIVTFSDHCVSDGALYANSGFVAEAELTPDYQYVKSNQRIHKFNYRKQRFQKDDALQYVEGMTEKQLAALNGLRRIWDAGKTRWAKNVLPQN